MDKFLFDKEQNVTISLAFILDSKGWDVVACHPPGGHTSFSLLDGRRSKGAYMPDVVAIKYLPEIQDYLVCICECKSLFKLSHKDVKKLSNLNDNHASWIGFRLQNHINPLKWLNGYKGKLQKIIAYEEGLFTKEEFPEDMIALKIFENEIKEKYIGANSPILRFGLEKTFSNK